MNLSSLTRTAARTELAVLLVASLLLAMWLVWVGLNGGYSANVWYPSALVAASLWSAVVIIGRRVLPADPIVRGAILLFAGLVALNYASIAWSASAGSALDAANELALYLIVAWIFALLPWTATSLGLLIVGWSLGVCALCVETLVRAAAAPTLTAFFVDGRFSTPMQYSNATGALAVMSFWPLLVLSARRELPAAARGLCLGAATFLVSFATLPQSRAALLGLGLVGVLVIVAAPGRPRHLLRIAVAAGALAVCLPRTVAVNRAVTAGTDVSPLLRHAAGGIEFTALGAALLGVALALAEDWLARRVRPRRPGPARAAQLRLVRQGALVAGALVVIILAVVLSPRLVDLIHTVVRSGRTDAATGSTRLLSASPEERLDYWRVALDLFKGHPLVGIGSGNFGRAYDAARTFIKHSAYTHDLPLRVLSETGIIGELLFAALVLLVGAALVRAFRARGGVDGALGLSAACVAAYFLIHSLLDWVDEFPALAVPAIALPMAAVGLCSHPRARPRTLGSVAPAVWPTRRAVASASIALVAVSAVTVALASGYLSQRLVSGAFAVFRADPQQAYHDLSLAHSIDPLAADPLTSDGTISLYLGRVGEAGTAFQRSLEQENAWYPRVELALIAASQGRFTPAASQIHQAIRLDRHDPVLLGVQRQILRRQRLNPLAINAQLLAEAEVTSSVQEPIR